MPLPHFSNDYPKAFEFLAGDIWLPDSGITPGELVTMQGVQTNRGQYTWQLGFTNTGYLAHIDNKIQLTLRNNSEYYNTISSVYYTPHDYFTIQFKGINDPNSQYSFSTDSQNNTNTVAVTGREWNSYTSMMSAASLYFGNYTWLDSAYYFNELALNPDLVAGNGMYMNTNYLNTDGGDSLDLAIPYQGIIEIPPFDPSLSLYAPIQIKVPAGFVDEDTSGMLIRVTLSDRCGSSNADLSNFVKLLTYKSVTRIAVTEDTGPSFTQCKVQVINYDHIDNTFEFLFMPSSAILAASDNVYYLYCDPSQESNVDYVFIDTIASVTLNSNCFCANGLNGYIRLCPGNADSTLATPDFGGKFNNITSKGLNPIPDLSDFATFPCPTSHFYPVSALNLGNILKNVSTPYLTDFTNYDKYNLPSKSFGIKFDGKQFAMFQAYSSFGGTYSSSDRAVPVKNFSFQIGCYLPIAPVKQQVDTTTILLVSYDDDMYGDISSYSKDVFDGGTLLPYISTGLPLDFTNALDCTSNVDGYIGYEGVRWDPTLTNFSIDFWIKLNNTGAIQYIFSASNGFFIRVNANRTITVSSGSSCTSIGTLVAGEWNHIAVVYDNNRWYLYIRGSMDDTELVLPSQGVWDDVEVLFPSNINALPCKSTVTQLRISTVSMSNFSSFPPPGKAPSVYSDWSIIACTTYGSDCPYLWSLEVSRGSDIYHYNVKAVVTNVENDISNTIIVQSSSELAADEYHSLGFVLLNDPDIKTELKLVIDGIEDNSTIASTPWSVLIPKEYTNQGLPYFSLGGQHPMHRLSIPTSFTAFSADYLIGNRGDSANVNFLKLAHKMHMSDSLEIGDFEFVLEETSLLNIKDSETRLSIPISGITPVDNNFLQATTICNVPLRFKELLTAASGIKETATIPSKMLTEFAIRILFSESSVNAVVRPIYYGPNNIKTYGSTVTINSTTIEDSEGLYYGELVSIDTKGAIKMALRLESVSSGTVDIWCAVI